MLRNLKKILIRNKICWRNFTNRS